MATARQIISMLNSHVQGDEEQFLSIALQVAAAEAQRGRKEVADELRRLVDAAREKAPSASSAKADIPIPIARPRGELQNLLAARYPNLRLSEVVLSTDVRSRLERILDQQRRRDRLRAFARVPSSRVLLIGPPGSGKTMTASALAGELRLPLFTIRLDSVMSRFMGETAAKLRLIFDQVGSVRAVYLFDEFDAVGGRRGAENDVGEMRRVLNSFLLFLEEENATDSLIIGATNHPELLDRALFRRFDAVIEYALPDDEAVMAVLIHRLGSMAPRKPDWSDALTAARGLSQAEIARAADEAVKLAILDEQETASIIQLVRALEERRDIRKTIAASMDN